MSRTAKVTGVLLLAIVIALVAGGFRLSEYSSHKQAPKSLGEDLIDALDKNDIARARQLLARGADVNVRDPSTGRTCLMAAATVANAEFTKLLIQRGADLNALDNSGSSALVGLLSSGHATPELTKLLLPQTHVLRRGGGTGSGPVCLAIQTHDPKIVAILLNAGASATDRDATGKPLLISAVETDDRAIVKELVLHHAVLSASGPNGERALKTAIKAGSEGIAQFLVRHGADCDCRDTNGDTALTEAAARGKNPELVREQIAGYAAAAEWEAFRRGYERGREYSARDFEKSDEAIDQVWEESFPASDPPSH